MEHTCPTCDRKFEGISDYPIVFVAKVVKSPLSSTATYLNADNTIFVGPRSKLENQRPPREVLDFFKTHPKANKYESQEWIWSLDQLPEDCVLPTRRLTLSEKVARLFREVSGESTGISGADNWEIGTYSRVQKGQLAMDQINKHVAPYLAHLVNLVGKEVSPSDILPSFSDGRFHSSRIPDTRYNLHTLELDNEFGYQILKQDNLPVPNLETSRPARKVALVVTESCGGTISFIKHLSVVGGIAYEGRLKK
ncbi:MAG: hypothetical protein AABX85_04415 [Nanoarchaeota archaeon]